MRLRLMPGARMLWIVVTKLIAPSTEEIPIRCSATIQASIPLPGRKSVDESGTYDVQPAAATSQKMDPYSTTPPATSSHHESMLRRGNAMSRAPIISGTRKFPNPAAIGTMTMKIIVVPCSEKSWL